MQNEYDNCNSHLFRLILSKTRVRQNNTSTISNDYEINTNLILPVFLQGDNLQKLAFRTETQYFQIMFYIFQSYT